LGGGPQSNATGYVSFLTLALYVAGLVLLPPSPVEETEKDGLREPAHEVIRGHLESPGGAGEISRGRAGGVSASERRSEPPGES
ncbi:MAG TPA: hypothetical protein VE642_12815, partial [Pyrinomonadaceae bacterium]|nr:hypothetical protein [Pyrinomonadaceae bacterium]